MRLRWALLVLLVLATCGACAGNPPPHPAPAHRFDSLLDPYLGIADWSCSLEHPSAWVRLSYHGLDLIRFRDDGTAVMSPSLLETIAHELAHLDQLRQLGCAEWARLSEDPAFVERLEREAECVAIRLVRKKECEP